MLCPTLHPVGAHDGFFREIENSELVTFGKLETAAIVAWIDRCAPHIEREQPFYDAARMHQTELRFYADLIERAKPATVAPTNRESCQETA